MNPPARVCGRGSHPRRRDPCDLWGSIAPAPRAHCREPTWLMCLSDPCSGQSFCSENVPHRQGFVLFGHIEFSRVSRQRGARSQLSPLIPDEMDYRQGPIDIGEPMLKTCGFSVCGSADEPRNGSLREKKRPRWDSNPRITDLQSVPLVHLGTRPSVGMNADGNATA